MGTNMNIEEQMKDYRKKTLEKIKLIGATQSSKILSENGIKISPQYLSTLKNRKTTFDQIVKIGKILLK